MTELQVDPKVQSFTSESRRMLVGGEWVESATGETFQTYNPSTGEVLADVAMGSTEDVDRAVRAARRAFEHGSPWRKLTPSERGRIVWRIGDLIEENAEEFAELEALDNGKNVNVAKAADVALAADQFRYMAGWATKIEGNTLPISAVTNSGAEFHSYTQREPVGVVGQIIPWNFPLLMAAWKLAPALTCGVTVVLKPAEQTPLSALRLGELMQEAGVPDGAVNIVTGFGDLGAHLAAHDDVDKVAFTGSTEVGKSIVQASTGNLKKVSLELGGKSPNVVFGDSPVETAVAGASHAIFFNHGQCCNAGSRLYVESGSFDEVVEGIAERAKNIKVGPGMDPSSELGPLVSQEQLDRVSGYLEAGAAEGAETVAGGQRHGDQGYFIEPTVLTNTRGDMKVVQEEIFGPVMVAQPFDDIEEIVSQANDTTYGLAAGVFTSDVSKAHKVAHRIKAGTVWVNTYHVFDAAQPFGGYRQSGWGREHGHNVLENYLETKSVCVQL